MHKRQAPIHFPCTADFASMKPVHGGRWCTACEEVVVDLSALGEEGARAKLADAKRAGERVCIRYVYDERGEVVFGAAARGARVVPEHALTRRVRRAVAVAAAAAVPVLIQACGGNGGGFEQQGTESEAGPDADADAGDAMPRVTFPDAGVD